MRRFWVRLLVLIGVATFGATSPYAAPWRFEAEGVAATVGQPDAATLVVGLRLAERGSFESAALALPDGSILEPESPLEPYPVGGDTTAILFIVDTSDPARSDAVTAGGRAIARMLEAAKPHQKFGLAAFDKDLRILVPVGASAAEVAAKLPELAAQGRITQLFLNVGEAVKAVTAIPATRRAVVLLSDGLSEDTAYTLERALGTARAAEVTVICLGYARSIAKETSLQNLRLLAEGTIGAFVQADEEGNLPEAFLKDPFAAVESGGTLRFDLSGRTAAEPVSAEIKLRVGGREAMVPVSLTLAPPNPAEPPLAMVAGAAVAGFLVLLAVFRLRRRKLAPLPEPHARLAMMDGVGSAFEMRSNTVTIGRATDNDLRFDNETVSRYHASLHLKDGVYTITDLDSANGMRVDGAEVATHALHDGMVVELGEVRFRFERIGEGKDAA